ncbi:helix-turn-helix domain-containing protein [Paenibacillus sp. NPDC056579]|uniref:AraC family transcriptional regulator n=1 Tax=unclassified Paenibacillus TaxID=185978 RepID=UPI001EF7FB21|nr:helix-turn-helix domain-containing protein [Paenibacillus sp. H1-7]ULL16317.1 AraC family transcriptional regulator [Paenibacillus sp. H1-7]
MQMINTVYFQYADKQWVGHGPLTKPYHLFMFVDKGSCAYRIAGERYVLEKGDILFIPEGMERVGEAVTEHAHSKYSAHWIGDGLLRHFPQFEQSASKFQASSLYSYLQRAFTQMHQLWLKKDPYYAPQCEGMLLEVMARVHQEQVADHYSGKQLRVVRQVRDYILQYYQEPLSIEELAHLTKRSASHLITSFKKHYGLAPMEYMHRIRIQKAQELLLETDFGMETIAVELGYCDAPYFNRMFKKLTGVSPAMYRKQNTSVPLK